MRQGQTVFQREHFGVSGGRRPIAGDQVHIESARAPTLSPNPIRRLLHLLGAMQPTVPSSRASSAISTALRNGPCRRRPRPRSHRPEKPLAPRRPAVEHRLQPGQPVAEVGSNRQTTRGHRRRSSPSSVVFGGTPSRAAARGACPHLIATLCIVAGARRTAPPAGTTEPRPPRRDRRATTATSPKVWGIGACGLCTVTSTACSRWSLITSSAISPATVSIRLRAARR